MAEPVLAVDLRHDRSRAWLDFEPNIPAGRRARRQASIVHADGG